MVRPRPLQVPCTCEDAVTTLLLQCYMLRSYVPLPVHREDFSNVEAGVQRRGLTVHRQEAQIEVEKRGGWNRKAKGARTQPRHVKLRRSPFPAGPKAHVPM